MKKYNASFNDSEELHEKWLEQTNLEEKQRKIKNINNKQNKRRNNNEINRTTKKRFYKRRIYY